MPVSAETAARMARSAVGIIGHAIARYNRGETVNRLPPASNVARRLAAEFSSARGISYAQANSIASRVLREWRAAEAMDAQPNVRQRIGAIPIDPTLSGEPRRIRYTVLVRRYDQTGDMVSYNVTVTADAPMTATEIQTEISLHMDDYTSDKNATQTAIDRLGPGQYVISTPIQVGRRD